MGPVWRNAAVGACALIALGASALAWAEELAQPTLELEGMTFVASRGTQNEVVLAAERARVETHGRVAHLDQVHAKLSSAPGVTALDMRCDHGTVRIETSDFDAQGNVRGTTGDGRRFRTTRLSYSHERGLVSTNSPVVIQDETGTYRGGGFRYHVRENRFLLLHGATVVHQ